MTLRGMRKLGVLRLLVSCLRCQHEALIDVSNYAIDTAVPSFIPRMNCTQCGGKRVEVGRTGKNSRSCRPSSGSIEIGAGNEDLSAL
jgi:hypothetical protein